MLNAKLQVAEINKNKQLVNEVKHCEELEQSGITW